MTLDPAIVRKIQQGLRAGRKQLAIARELGVCRNTVSAIAIRSLLSAARRTPRVAPDSDSQDGLRIELFGAERRRYQQVQPTAKARYDRRIARLRLRPSPRATPASPGPCEPERQE